MTTLALNSSPPSTPRDLANSLGSDTTPSFQIYVVDKQLPLLSPDQLTRTFEKLRALLSVWPESTLERNGQHTKVDDATSKLSTTNKKLSLLFTEAGLSEKADRVGENFT